MLLEHLVPRHMVGGNMIEERRTMTEEDVICRGCDGRGFMPTTQMTLEEFGFEFH